MKVKTAIPKSSSIRSSHAHGFTLVELLVVIVIIAVLASLGMMGIPRIRRSAQTTASMGNLRQIHSLMQGYVVENNNRYPFSVYEDEGNGSIPPCWRRKVWDTANGPFEGSNDQITTAMTNSGYASVMWCPLMVAKYGKEQHWEGRGSYSINRFFIPDTWGGGIRTASSPQLIGRREPYIMGGSPYKGNEKYGTFYHNESSKFPYDTHWANLNYAYGAGGDSALGLFIDGRVDVIPKAKGIQLNPLLSNPSTLE
jgi:prepilin-type N-terminal cleavage/methylation domain-containing protein